MAQNNNSNRSKWLAFVTLVTLLAGIVQISGYSIKDLFPKKEKSTNTEHPQIEKLKDKDIDDSIVKEILPVIAPKVQSSKSIVKNQTIINNEKGGKIGTVITGDSNRIEIKQDF
jgi:hypothetical protein